MLKKITITISIIIIVLIIVGFVTNYIDSGRVTTGHEPKYCLKTISKDERRVTYWGLGYKVIRYVGTSPKEPYQNNIGVKMGNWFMKYELSKDLVIKIEVNKEIITISNKNDINRLSNILESSKYNSKICNGISSHKISFKNKKYYLKESCKRIQTGNKQADITSDDLETILEIIAANKD